MEYEEEVTLLKYLGKGQKARTSTHYQKYSLLDKYWQKPVIVASKNEATFAPSLESMLHTASRKTQAIFKISSYGKGEKRIAAHLCYISRRGQLELEDQNGKKFASLEDQKEVIKNWSVDFSKRVDSRDTLHLVLSTPPGTNRETAYRAAKEFLLKEFKESKHDYLLVAHNDTDNPHVHAVIKMVSILGKKLDPRKAYLNRVRQEYARICRTYDIQVEASTRAERGLAGQSEKSEFVHMRKNGRQPKVDINLRSQIANKQNNQRLKHSSEDKMKIRNQVIRKRYANKANVLIHKSRAIGEKTEKVKCQNVAKYLDEYAKTMPLETTRVDNLCSQIRADCSLQYGSADFYNNPLDEYYAVILGVKNEEGIYESPTKILCNKISNLLGQENKLKEKNEVELDVAD